MQLGGWTFDGTPFNSAFQHTTNAMLYGIFCSNGFDITLADGNTYTMEIGEFLPLAKGEYKVVENENTDETGKTKYLNILGLGFVDTKGNARTGGTFSNNTPPPFNDLRFNPNMPFVKCNWLHYVRLPVGY